jgi:hypothetical protein
MRFEDFSDSREDDDPESNPTLRFMDTWDDMAVADTLWNELRPLVKGRRLENSVVRNALAHVDHSENPNFGRFLLKSAQDALSNPDFYRIPISNGFWAVQDVPDWVINAKVSLQLWRNTVISFLADPVWTVDVRVVFAGTDTNNALGVLRFEAWDTGYGDYVYARRSMRSETYDENLLNAMSDAWEASRTLSLPEEVLNWDVSWRLMDNKGQPLPCAQGSSIGAAAYWGLARLLQRQHADDRVVITAALVKLEDGSFELTGVDRVAEKTQAILSCSAIDKIVVASESNRNDAMQVIEEHQATHRIVVEYLQ